MRPVSTRIRQLPIFSYLIGILFLTACNSSPDYLTIKGNLPELPDGMMLLKGRYPETIVDSTPIRDGVFEFKIPKKEYPEPIKTSLYYLSPEGERKGFVVTTGYKGKAGFGGIPGTDTFMLEDGIEINGPLLEEKGPYMTFFHTTIPIRPPILTTIFIAWKIGWGLPTNLAFTRCTIFLIQS
jgi:hypothetical protein